MPNILITGANGLLGRLFAKTLAGYGNIFGIDHVNEGTASQRFIIDGAKNHPLLIQPFAGKYFKIDITDVNALKKTFEEIGHIDVVIHLATALETESPAMIERVNQGGTTHIFKLCEEWKIQKILLASSIMTVSGKLLDEEPYCHINTGNYDLIPSAIPKITTSSRAVPQGINPSVRAYIQSKLYMEDLAMIYAKQNKMASICLRFGAISSTDIPYDTPGLRSIWCSHRDAAAVVIAAVQKLINNAEIFSKTYFVCSHNDYLWVDIESLQQDFNVALQDNAEMVLCKHQQSGGQATVAAFSVLAKGRS